MATTNFPALKGSEKQIAWAEDIRKEMLEEKVNGIRVADFVNQFFTWPEAKQQQLADMIKANPDSDYARIYYIATEESAKWFIENRPHGCLKAAGKTIMKW